jgi:uncharacterized membrane-anchored protein
MKNKSVYIIAFILIVIAQWLVPAQIISEHEDVAANGKVFRFKTAPVDPYDAFRGKYIILSFKENKGKITSQTKQLNYGDEIFVTFADSSGYALVESVSVEEPKNNQVYVKAKVDYIDNNFIFFNSKKQKNAAQAVHIDYPFERYYMNEIKAPKAETAYNESNRERKDNVYAEVAIKNGVGIVKDVIIDNIPIKDYVDKP